MEPNVCREIADQLRGLAKVAAASFKPEVSGIPKEKLDAAQVCNFLKFFSGDRI